ncbi:MAG TPA: hypothetical protein PKZ78_00560 [Candidatus Goldiibacteriota bacterium]|nr:hypothetical protein [Candidatus Goldiibacteriota bacterium]
MSIKIQVSKSLNGIVLKIYPAGYASFATFAIYEKKSAAPTIPTDLKATIAGIERSYAIALPATTGIYFYQVVGTYNGVTVSSNVDFIVYDVLGYRQELKAAIYQKLKLSTELTALVSTRIYAGFPQSLTEYPCVIFWLDEMSMPDMDRQHYEAPTLRVKVFARSQSDMDKICDAINQIIIDYSYEGKEVVIYCAKKFSETGTNVEADGLTLTVDMFFRLTTERITLPRIS